MPERVDGLAIKRRWRAPRRGRPVQPTALNESISLDDDFDDSEVEVDEIR